MSKNLQESRIPVRLPSLLCVALTFLFATFGWLVYQGVSFKYCAITAGVGIVLLLWCGDLKRLSNFPSMFLLGYAEFTMLTIFWALSDKFFLHRYAVAFTALFFFLYAVFCVRNDVNFARRAASICVGVSSIYAVLGVELASTGFFMPFFSSVFGENLAINGFNGARLFGVFSNSNIETSFYSIGILFGIALICNSKGRHVRALWMVAVVCNAFAMLLSVSLGAILCFFVASLGYLIFARKNRGAVLLRLSSGLIYSLVGIVIVNDLFASFPQIPTLMLVFICIVAAVLELLFGELLSTALNSNGKLTIGVLLSLASVLLLYIGVGLHLSSAHTFEQNMWFTRSVTLASGEHTLQINSDENMTIAIFSMTPTQVVAGASDQLFYGTEVREATFIVPEGSVNCRFDFLSSVGSTIYSATLDGKKQIVLTYRIFPAFFANRITNPLASVSVMQRMVYVQDGLKLFRLSPLAGLGDGAFESAVSMVQDYEYETNHSHNQYIETLVEGGVIGFVLFVGALIAMAVALWKSRKKMQEDELAWIYPALCAEFTMSTLQMLWDVSMSVTVFACMIYTLYGLIVSTCAEPFMLKKTKEHALTTGQKKKTAEKAERYIGIRVACSVLPLFFIVSVSLNIYAQKLIREPVESIDEFMDNLTRAAKMDLYEHNDITLSYVQAAMQNDAEGIYREQADEYARQLSRVQSNTIPYYLVVYYLNTQQYELAIDEAKAGARYSASDSDMWNNCIDALKQMFIDTGEYSPLLRDDGTLLRELTEYQEMLSARDAASIKPISLNANSKEFFDKLTQLSACNGDTEAMYAVMTAVSEG